MVYAEYGHSRPHSAETGVGTLVERVFEEVNFANDPSNLSFLPLSVCIHFGQNNFFSSLSYAPLLAVVVSSCCYSKTP